MKGGGNLENNDSPVTKKLRKEEVEVEAEAEAPEEEQPSSSSSSVAHNEPQKVRSSGNDHDCEEDYIPSAGAVLQRSPEKSEPVHAMYPQDEAPEAQKVEPESSRASVPAVTVSNWIELPAVQRNDQLHVAPDSVHNSENAMMPSAMGGLPEQFAGTLPTDQSVQGYANVQGPMSMYAIPYTNYNFSMLHSASELRMDYSQVPNLHLQTQVDDGFAAKAQWVEWLHLQQQLAMHQTSMLSRLQDLQCQGCIPHDSVLTDNAPYATGAPPFVQLPSNLPQKGPGDYNILSSASPTFDPVLVPATFTCGLGLLGPSIEANRRSEEGEPFGRPQINTDYGDLVHQGRSQQLAARPVSPVQVAQGHNRIPVPNSIYDPMYEALGLPVDPHLRLFLASQRDSGR